MKMSAQILKRMLVLNRRFESRSVTEDEEAFLEHVCIDLCDGAAAEARCLAILLQDELPPHRVRAQAARGFTRETLCLLAGFAPSGTGVVREVWPALLPDEVPLDALYSVAPLASSHEQLTLISDGQSDPDALQLVVNLLALAVERDGAVRAARRLGELFNAGPVVLFRRDNSEGWPVEEVSPNVTREFGWKTECVRGQPFAQLMHPEDRARVREEVTEAVAEGRARFAQKYRVIDGTDLAREVFELTDVIRDKRGDPTHFHGYLFDDGERRRSEEQKMELLQQLRQSQKLQAIGTLANGVAHEFNNVLAVILTSLELADLEPGLMGHPDLGAATQAALKGRELVRQMLLVGHSDGCRVPNRLQQIIGDSLRLVRSILPANVALHVALDPEVPTVLADATGLQQMLINLVTNAVFAMPHGGSLDVCLRFREEGNRVEFEVKDTGCGMPPEVLAQALDPFFTTKPVGQGRGLGLTMVYAIAQAHGASVELQSAPGTGTVVRVIFPRAEEVGVPAGVPAPTFPLGTVRVAVVDDEPAVAHSTQRLVSRLGYGVMTFSCARDLLEEFQGHPDAFDLVMTDQKMPEMTGTELGRELRARGVQVPVLLLTGLPMEIDPEAISPPFAVLGKPYKLDELGHALGDLFGSHNRHTDVTDRPTRFAQ